MEAYLNGLLYCRAKVLREGQGVLPEGGKVKEVGKGLFPDFAKLCPPSCLELVHSPKFNGLG